MHFRQIPSLCRKIADFRAFRPLYGGHNNFDWPLWPWPLTSKTNRGHPFLLVKMSTKFDEDTYNGLVSIVFTMLFPCSCTSFVTLTSKSNSGHPFIIVNISAKFDEDALNGLDSITFTGLFPYTKMYVHYDPDLWPPKTIEVITTSRLKYLQSSMKMCARFSLYPVHRFISIYVYRDLDLRPLSSQINRVHPLTMVNIFAKFDKDIHCDLKKIFFIFFTVIYI